MLDYKEFQEFVKRSKITPLYITKSGSQLYGTNTPESDTNYKGIFIADKDSIILKQDPEHFTYTSGQQDSKNTKLDIDITLYSVHKWNKLLAKGETGAVDLLFSVFDLSSTVYINPGFERLVLNNYQRMLSSNLHAFVGYCVGQSKRYNIKGERYQELLVWQNILNTIPNQGDKMAAHLNDFKALLDTPVKFKYIQLLEMDGSRDASRQLWYLSLLGKNFSEETTIGYIAKHVNESIHQFGNRTKAATTNGIDWKGISHAYRVILEVEELLQTGFIKFPLRHRNTIKAVKAGEVKLETIMRIIDHKIDYVKKLQESSDLPKKMDQSVLNDYILNYFKD